MTRRGTHKPPFRTKPGKHGTLYRYRVTYRDRDPAAPDEAWFCWAYEREHAEELFYDSIPYAWDEDWKILSINRVREPHAPFEAFR